MMNKESRGFIFFEDLKKFLSDQEQVTQNVSNIPVHDGYTTMLHNTALGKLAMIELVRAWATDESNKNLSNE